MAKFMSKYPDASLHGFFSCKATGEFRVVVLASVDGPKQRANEAIEFQAATAAALVLEAENGGVDIGEVETVERLCRTAGLPVKRR